MVRGGGARQRFRSALLEAQLNRDPFRAHLRKIQILSALARDDDEVDSVRKERGPFAKALAAEPLDPVSSHRTTDFAGHDHAQSRRTWRGRLSGNEQCEMRCTDPATLALLAHELRVPAQPTVAPKFERHYFL